MRDLALTWLAALVVCLGGGVIGLALLIPTQSAPIVITEPLPFPLCMRVSGKGGGHGSATPIMQRNGKLWLLTAGHCLPAESVDGLTVVDQIRHPSRDLALISVMSTARCSVLAPAFPAFGDPLWAAGHQAGALLLVSGYQGSKPGRMSCPVFYGASGGPVWNEQRQLVGIIVAVGRGRLPFGASYVIPHISYYVPVVDLAGWILETVHR